MSKFDFRPYVSGDLEFTSLEPEYSEITQMGFVLDTAEYGDVRSFPYFHCFVYHDNIQGGPKGPECDAIFYNQHYFAERMRHKKGESKYDWLKPKVALNQLLVFLKKANELAVVNYDKPKNWEKPMKSVQIAGKNFGHTDAHVLLNFTKRHAPEMYQEMKDLVGYQFIDAGSVMHPYFDYVPGLSAINEKTGRTEVNHNAYDDSIDVIFGIRAGYCGLRQIPLNETTFDSKQRRS